MCGNNNMETRVNCQESLGESRAGHFPLDCHILLMQGQLDESCIRCLSFDVVQDTSAGDIVCRSCGEIQASRIIDASAEWREFDDDDRGSSGSASRSSCTVDRFGSSSTYFTGGLSDAARQSLAKTQILSTDKRELKMMKAAEIISDIGSTLRLTRKILDCAYHLCSRAVLEESTQAKRNGPLAAAVISLACRLEGYPRTLQEISNATQLDVHTINRVQSTLARDLHIATGVVPPQDLVQRIVCNPLIRMTDPVMVQHIKDICCIASDEGVWDGQQPQAAAAASIIFAAAIRSYVERNKLQNNDSSSSGSSSSSGGGGGGNNGNSKSSNNNNSNNSTTQKHPQKPTDINITLTIESSFASLNSVKRAYASLLQNADIVIPQSLKTQISKSLPPEKVWNWIQGLPTFDQLFKFSKNSKVEKNSKIEKSLKIQKKSKLEKEQTDRKELEKHEKISVIVDSVIDPSSIKNEKDCSRNNCGNNNGNHPGNILIKQFNESSDNSNSAINMNMADNNVMHNDFDNHSIKTTIHSILNDPSLSSDSPLVTPAFVAHYAKSESKSITEKNTDLKVTDLKSIILTENIPTQNVIQNNEKEKENLIERGLEKVELKPSNKILKSANNNRVIANNNLIDNKNDDRVNDKKRYCEEDEPMGIAEENESRKLQKISTRTGLLRILI